MTPLPALTVRRADAADRPTVERLWLMFSHDLSEFRGHLPNPDGSFHDGWLQSAFSDPDWAPYLLTADADAPVGFAFVRGLTGPVRGLNSFFVVRGARRSGLGLHAVRQIVALHPGRWQIAFQDANAPAARFWRTAAAHLAGTAWTEELRPVPGRPELAPDSWISFTTA
ncbi:GNAT family N-acetyltransferase [Kitasatospora sp. NPDC059795]|uniref:GNAT family N-acetyltransferase n=1 Tax=Kitasatospora sp. NPDC059795 TaxID=3346949 RepID=UPI003669571D